MTRLPGGATVSLDTKGLALGSPDGDVSLRIGGRLHLDGGVADIRPGAAGPALGDDFAVRRAWLEAFLTVHRDTEVAFEYDFADSKQPINDAVVSYKGLEPVIVSVGNFKEPFSLDQLISNNNTLFVERSLLDAFAPARDFGAAVGAHGERWTAVAGVFGGNANTGIGDNGVAGTVRVTYAPVLSKDEVLHIGIAGSYRDLDPARMPLSFDSTPENNLFAASLVDTGTLRAADAARFGAELLYAKGPYRVKAEYALVDVGMAGDGGSRLFQSGYAEAAWVINGEGPAYKLVPDYGSTYAILGGVEVADGQRLSQGGIGVFEIGARVSAITLRDGNTGGGAQQDVTAGLNWYPDKNVKVMADYIHARADPSATSVTGGRIESDAFLSRLQFTW